MKKVIIILLFCLCGFLVARDVPYSLQIVVENWLTDDVVADFNKDGIVNVIDYALIQSYGSDEYGLDNYGN